MKKIIINTILTVSAFSANAEKISVQQLKEGFELRADIYEVSQDGKKILSQPEVTSFWVANPETGMIRGGWSSGMNEGLIALIQEWKITPEGAIAVRIAEFSKDVREKDESQMENDLLEKREFVLKNMEPVVWEVKNIKSKKYIVRFVPIIKPSRDTLGIKDFPIAGESMSIYDNNGFLWANELDFSGTFVGASTHRGTLLLSYQKFKGSKEMGNASGTKILIKPNSKMTITLDSKSAFLPAGMVAKVYAIYLPEKKSKGPNSVGSFGSDKEDKFLKHLER